jgi:hypothetical protein
LQSAQWPREWIGHLGNHSKENYGVSLGFKTKGLALLFFANFARNAFDLGVTVAVEFIAMTGANHG